jgi:hypothetical protein
MTMEYDGKPAVDLESARAWYDRWTWARDQKASIEAIEKEARMQLEVALGDNEIGLLDGQPVISWSWSIPKNGRFDSKAFEADNPELASKYKVKKPTRSFRPVTED